MPARYPGQWAQLAAHPTLGAAVQHLLLDRAETQAFEDARLHAATPAAEELPADAAPALSEDLLRACRPAPCLPEPADLPNPQVTARRTLHHIAHRALEHLRQIPADEVLARHEPEVALKILLDHRGRSTGRWEALAAAMTFEYDEARITFGELLDSLSTPLRKQAHLRDDDGSCPAQDRRLDPPRVTVYALGLSSVDVHGDVQPADQDRVRPGARPRCAQVRTRRPG
ncbi:hypothetical protein [Streptomyces sp. TE33382]